MKPIEKGNLKQQAAAERLHNAIGEVYLSVMEQVEASRPGEGVTALDIIQSYNIFLQSIDNLIQGWTEFWAKTIGSHEVDATPADRMPFNSKT